MSNSKSNCVICLENSKIYVSCPHCEEGNYCKKCRCQTRQLQDVSIHEDNSVDGHEIL